MMKASVIPGRRMYMNRRSPAHAGADFKLAASDQRCRSAWRDCPDGGPGLGPVRHWLPAAAAADLLAAAAAGVRGLRFPGGDLAAFLAAELS